MGVNWTLQTTTPVVLLSTVGLLLRPKHVWVAIGVWTFLFLLDQGLPLFPDVKGSGTGTVIGSFNGTLTTLSYRNTLGSVVGWPFALSICALLTCAFVSQYSYMPNEEEKESFDAGRFSRMKKIERCFWPIAVTVIIFLFQILNLWPDQPYNAFGTLGLGLVLVLMGIAWLVIQRGESTASREISVLGLIATVILVWLLCVYIFSFYLGKYLRARNKESYFATETAFAFYGYLPVSALLISTVLFFRRREIGGVVEGVRRRGGKGTAHLISLACQRMILSPGSSSNASG